jgi:hypothetical protein
VSEDTNFLDKFFILGFCILRWPHIPFCCLRRIISCKLLFFSPFLFKLVVIYFLFIDFRGLLNLLNLLFHSFSFRRLVYDWFQRWKLHDLKGVNDFLVSFNDIIFEFTFLFQSFSFPVLLQIIIHVPPLKADYSSNIYDV